MNGDEALRPSAVAANTVMMTAVTEAGGTETAAESAATNTSGVTTVSRRAAAQAAEITENSTNVEKKL